MSVAPMMLPAISAIYNRYEILSWLARDRFSGSLAGKLLLRPALDQDGLADMVAASVAGACSLCVEPEAERLREALRAGLCDFVIGTLDEALRILKNELRRGLPVSVGLSAEPDPTLAEMTERGLQPDLVSLPLGESFRIFVDRRAVALPEHYTADPGTALVEWSLTTEAARSMPHVARTAAQVLDAARPDTRDRQRWLDNAPRYLGRAFAGYCCIRMTTAESAAFAAAARAQYPAIHITRDGAVL